MMTDEESRVLIVAPTGRDASLISGLLESGGIGALECESLDAALQAAELQVGAIVIADEALDLGSTDRMRQFREAQPAWSDVPVILLIRRGEGSDSSAPPLCGLGQVSLIERPVGRRPFLTAVQAALRARARQYEARAQLAEMQRIGDELLVANSFKDELLGLVSHELRTPLTGILGCANILRRRFGELDATDRELLLDDLGNHGTRLQRVIENMLILSRAEATAETNIEPVLLQRILPAILAGLRPLAGSRSLDVSVDADLPPVNVNAQLVEQVVVNLVRNSEKYAAENEPVEVHVANVANVVGITVADHGRVFAQPEVEQMFEAFYRDPESSQKVSGLGLGLPVCKRLTEVQGGSITARPRAGGGIEITVSFPTARE